MPYARLMPFGAVFLALGLGIAAWGCKADCSVTFSCGTIAGGGDGGLGGDNNSVGNKGAPGGAFTLLEF